VSSRSLQMSQRVHTLPVSVIRAIYFGAALELGFDLAYMLYPNLSIDLPKELSDDIALMQLISRIPSLVATPNLPEAIDFTFKLQVVASTVKTDTLWVKMQTLQDKIAHSQLNHWSESDRITWGVNLQNELSEQIEFTGEWLSSEEDLAQLERYYWANIFFLKCQEKFNQVPDFFHFISGKTLCYPG
jgi:hypothetical protein